MTRVAVARCAFPRAGRRYAASYRVTLTPEGDGPDGIVRLRRALKLLLRATKLKADRVEILEDTPDHGQKKGERNG